MMCHHSDSVKHGNGTLVWNEGNRAWFSDFLSVIAPVNSFPFTFPAIACWLKSLRRATLKSTHATTQACDDLKTTTAALDLSRVSFDRRVAAATVTGGFTASHWRDSRWQVSFRLQAWTYPVRRQLSPTALRWTRLLYTEASWKDKSSTCQSESGTRQSADRITWLAKVHSLQ